MSETKWTPGPWFAIQQTDKAGKSLGWIIEHANGRIGWSCYATARPNEGERPPHPIAGVNAHLIAAAPELYEALRKAEQLLDVADDWHLSDVEIDGELVSTTVLRDEFRAALARARGEQP